MASAWCCLYEHSVSHVAIAICRGLATLRQEDTCTDFTIQVQDKTFRCHKVILASVSDYFKAMFTSGMKEATKNEAVLDNVNPDCFELILDLLYAQNSLEDPLIDLTDEEAIELFRVADMLQMQCITEGLMIHFETTISTKNCVERMVIGKEEEMKDLYKIAWEFILSHFDMVVKDNALQACTFEDFLSIISDEKLKVEREENMWYAISNWVKFDKENRQDSIYSLMQHCSLTDVSFQYLTETIAFDSIVRGNNKATSLACDAVRYRHHPSIHGFLELNYRRSTNKVQVDVLFGESIETECTILKMFRSSDGAWTKDILVDGPASGFACCVYSDSVYVSGGNEQAYKHNLYQFSGTTMSWRKVKGILPKPLTHHTMVATDGQLYAVSGVSGTRLSWEVLEYCIKQNTWHTHGEVVSPVTHASSVCLNEKIYIVGGLTDDSQPLQVIQEYDLNSKSATIICDLPSPSPFSQSLIRRDTVYILTTNGEVFRFETPEMKLHLVATIPELATVQHFGIAIRDNHMKIFCGDTTNLVDEDTDQATDDGVFETSHEKNIVANLDTGDIEIVPTSLNPFCINGCVTLVINCENKSVAAPPIPPRIYNP